MHNSQFPQHQAAVCDRYYGLCKHQPSSHHIHPPSSNTCSGSYVNKYKYLASLADDTPNFQSDSYSPATETTSCVSIPGRIRHCPRAKASVVNRAVGSPFARLASPGRQKLNVSLEYIGPSISNVPTKWVGALVQ
jgi:hypothetical protein